MGNPYSVHIASVSCFIQVLATVIAECTILGYIKHIPQDLTGMYGVGKAFGQLFEPIVYIVIFLSNLQSMKFFFFLFLLQGCMLMNFDWFEYQRGKHKQY